MANHCCRDRGLRRGDCRRDSGHSGAHLPDPHVLGTSDGHLYRDTGSTLDCHFGEHGDFTRTCTSTGAPSHGDRASTAAGSSAAPPIPASTCPQRLRSQANGDYSVVSSEATGLWVPQLSSKQPGLVADGITWDCDSIWAEHVRLRGLYGAKLLWSGDWPHTYGHDDYWVTVAGYTYDTAEGARQWCQDHGRDVPEHCYPTQIR